MSSVVRPIPSGLGRALRALRVDADSVFAQGCRASLRTDVGLLLIDLVAGGAWVMSAIVTRLGPQAERGALLVRSGQLALGRMFKSDESLALDPDGKSLLLQRLVLPGATSGEASAALSAFLNSVEWWRHAVHQPG